MKKNVKYGILSGSILLFLQFIITKIFRIDMPFSHQVFIYIIILISVNGIIFYLLRDKKRIRTNQYIVPFENAIINIHLGEANHVFIMKSFFRAQEEAVAILKTKIPRKKTLNLQKVWDKYKNYYELNAKKRIHSLFAVIDKPSNDLLYKHLADIIKEIKKIA